MNTIRPHLSNLPWFIYLEKDEIPLYDTLPLCPYLILVLRYLVKGDK